MKKKKARKVKRIIKRGEKGWFKPFEPAKEENKPQEELKDNNEELEQ